jgi:hypothetical protein
VLLVLVATALLQIRYLNTAMEHFGNSEVVSEHSTAWQHSIVVPA